MKEALLYEKLREGRLHCYLCSHHCKIAESKFGICGVRQNLNGVLYSHVYGKPIATNIDPIEKKPLYHFLPGSVSFSIATFGCNFRCSFCQNWDISQSRVSDGQTLRKEEVAPEEIVKAAIENGCKSISYTYTEPTIFFEYALDIARLAKEKSLYNNFVTNGFMSPECLKTIKPFLDAANVDLKFFNEGSYKKICGARLQPVLDSIKLMHDLGIWVEVTTLVVPQENDNQEELEGIARFIAGVDKNIPWHISRFHPNYQLTKHSATPLETLEKAAGLGRQAGLNYIYLGNVWGEGNDTHCPHCKKLLIRRQAFGVLDNHIKGGKCAFCKQEIAGIFQ
jgi:pyruvate formate lyase activating enzyme